MPESTSVVISVWLQFEKMCREHGLHQVELNTKAKQKCNSVWDLKAILKREHNIEVTESRGRWSYLPEYRKRPITSRRLGNDYSRERLQAEKQQHTRHRPGIDL